MLDIAGILKAEGRAEGKAEGISASLRSRIRRNRITVDQAHAEVDELRADHVITPSEADDIRARLG